MGEQEAITNSEGASDRRSSRQKLEACVRRIAQQEGVPPFGQHATEVIARTLDPEGGSSGSLVRVVLKDLGLTSQILRAANSALYNRSGRPILSVTHGIVLMGWETLRNLVSTVRYIEHFANRSPGLRELMLLSTLSAVHSRDIACSLGYPSPEEAHLCGLFRNVGEVLIACHKPEEYSKIILLMDEENIDVRAACLRVLDFSWDEVGLRVAIGWNMPPKIYVCLRGAQGPLQSPLDRCLASITDCARDLTHAMYRDGMGADAAAALGRAWITDPQGRRVMVSPAQLRRMTNTALKETQETFLALGIPTDDLRLDRQATKARRLLASVPVFGEAGCRSLEDAAEAAGRKLRDGDFELTTLVSGLLDAVCAAGFDRAVFALLSDDHTAIRGRLASGQAIENGLSRFDFPVDNMDGPIRTALRYKNDVLVDCTRDGRYDGSALTVAMEPAAFALFPIVVDHKPVGCLYADRHHSAPDLQMARASLVRVRNTMAAAIKAKGQRRDG